MIKQDFNRNWTVEEVKTAFSSMMNRMQKQATPPVINLPHDAMILTERDKESPANRAGGFFKPQDLTYTKNFFVANEDKGKAIFLEFEGVYMCAVVKVNGEYAGKCDYGYSNFFIRINDLLKYGENNIVVVNAMNTMQQNSRWYSGNGIYRNVKLLIGEPVHIVPDGLRVTTIDSSGEISAIRVETELKNEKLTSETGYLTVTISDSDGKRVCEDSVKFTIRAGDQINVEQMLYLKNAKLWSPDDPNLHTCETVVSINGEEIDKDNAMFGIRKLQLDTLHGLRINGKSYKLKGGCIHHDNGLLGSATFEDAEDRRVRFMKMAGYNAIRSAHNPTSKALLDACDKHGVMVMDEYSDIWTYCKSKFDYSIQLPDHWEADIERLVKRNYNHPSVIMYSIGNEIPEVGAKITAGFARKLIKKIRSLDNTRFITNGINPLVAVMDRMNEVIVSAGLGDSGGNADGKEINEMMSNLKNFKNFINNSPLVDDAIEESCMMLDIVGYNYSTVRYARDHEKYPNRVIVGSETFPTDLAENWKEVESHPHVLGDFSWTAWDYLGEAGLGTIRYSDTMSNEFYGAFPQLTAECGDFDITGHRLPISYWREIVWGGRNHVPYISVQKPERYGQEAKTTTWSWTDSVSSWTWPGFEGKSIVVEVYSDADEVELYVNKKPIGRKAVGGDGKEFYCSWDTIYEIGELEAVAYMGGEEVGRNGISTADTPLLKVTKESNSIRAGSNDLCYVSVELADKNGTLNTATSDEISFKIEGPATIQGCGTGNPKADRSFFGIAQKPYYGRALAIVRAGENEGVAGLTISAEGLEPVTIEIPVV